MTGESPEASLYFHLPFCSKKCPYCHFYVIPDKKEHKLLLMKALKQEWNSLQAELKGRSIVSIYFGGGTPFLMGPDHIGKILSWVKQDNAEITLEANPEDVTEEKIAAFRQAGINRISLGVQSLDDSQLKTLGRTHSAEQAKQAVIDCFNAGIKNISIDLMYDLPNQTLELWSETLKQACELPVTHLSLYNLTIEPHTLFFKQKETISKVLPNEETSAEILQMAISAFEEAGLKQYEISAFSRPGHTSKHNSGYWTGRPFFGLGPSAFSYWDNKRFRNIANLNKYARMLEEGNSPIDFSEELDPLAKSRELFVLKLRLVAGVELGELEQLDRETKDHVDQLHREGFLHRTEGHLQLTEKGRLFYDKVAADLI